MNLCYLVPVSGRPASDERPLPLRLKEGPLPALGLIAAVELLSFGPFLDHRGFYADDWIFFRIQGGAGGGALGFARALAGGGFLARPLEILHYPLFYALGTAHPALDQAVLLLLKVAEGWLLFRLLDRLFEWRSLAFWAALLSLAYPDRSATHLWFANSPQGVSVVAALASLLLHEDWIRTRRPSRLAGGLALYVAALLDYESAAFLPLLLGAGLAARAASSGTPVRRAVLSACRDLTPYAGAFAAAVLWMWGGPLLMSGTPNPKPLQLSLAAAWEVYSAGFSALGPRTFLLCARSAPLAMRYLPGALLVLYAAVFLAAAVRPVPEPEPGEGARRRALLTALATAAAAFVAGYAPYVFSRHPYVPDVVGIMNRLNAVGAWSGGIVLAALLATLFRGRPAPRQAGLALLLAAFTWTNAFACLQWAIAWQTTRRIAAGAAARARGLPPGAMVVLMDSPGRIGGAPVLGESWDFDEVLKRATGRRDLSGRVAGPRLRFGAAAVEETPGAADWPRTEPWRYPYRGLYAYRFRSGSLEQLSGPPPAP